MDFKTFLISMENWLRDIVRDEVAKALLVDHQQQKPERQLTREEVCAMLRISKPTLWAKTKTGEIPCIHVGRRVLYAEAAIKKYMEDNK